MGADDLKTSMTINTADPEETLPGRLT